MSTAYQAPLLAESCHLAPGFQCFTTGRGFSSSVDTPLREDGENLRDLFFPGNPPLSLVFARQVHGINVVAIDSVWDPVTIIPECDSLVSRLRNVALVIRTADCIPVVMADQESGLFGACHAGWRGTFGNVVAATVQALVHRGADAGRIHMWIGPGISGGCYEVSPELASEFRRVWGHLEEFTVGRLVDLPRLNFLQAIGAGLDPGRIQRSNRCTHCEEVFHSHRRQGRARGHLFTVCGFLPDRELEA